MDQLYTPWRYGYLTRKKASQHCFFCSLAEAPPSHQNLLLLRQQRSFIVLNRYPYSVGHLMIAPLGHVARLSEAKREVAQELMETARHCEAILQKIYEPDGFNIGFNLGKSAGAGVAGHLHLHVVPRWHGDANFVSVVGETRVLPEDLKTTDQKLRPEFGAVASENQP